MCAIAEEYDARLHVFEKKLGREKGSQGGHGYYDACRFGA